MRKFVLIFSFILSSLHARAEWLDSTGTYNDSVVPISRDTKKYPPNTKLTLYHGAALKKLSSLRFKNEGPDLVYFDDTLKTAVDYGFDRADGFDAGYVVILKLEIPSDLVWIATRFLVVKPDEVPDLTPYVTHVAVIPAKTRFRWRMENRLQWRTRDEFLRNPEGQKNTLRATCDWLLREAGLQIAPTK